MESNGPTYQDLTKTPESARDVIKGSYVKADYPLKSWERGRRFIANVINHSGSVLDIGCANGFFLKSLQEWSEFELIPYGIDNEEENILASKKIFPKWAENFVLSPFDDFLDNYPVSFPEQFDFIYWAVWTNREVTRDQIDTLLEHISNEGRLILGFYPDTSEDPSDIKDNIGRLRNMGFKFEEVGNANFPDRSDKLIIFEKTV